LTPLSAKGPRGGLAEAGGGAGDDRGNVWSELHVVPPFAAAPRAKGAASTSFGAAASWRPAPGRNQPGGFSFSRWRPKTRAMRPNAEAHPPGRPFFERRSHMSVSVRVPHLLLLGCGALALSSCQTVEEEVTEVVGNNFEAIMLGANEVPVTGDPDGWGKARISINDATNQVCTDLEVRDIATVTAAHIHRGSVGQVGEPVINLDRPDDDDSNDCDTVGDALVDSIRNNPGAFYVNVHTPDYPDGALRGQIVDIEE
jgi:hypothetical protein